MKLILSHIFFWALTAPVLSGTSVKAYLESTAYKDSWVNVDAIIDGGRMRLDFSGPLSKSSLLYDRDSSLLTLVDHLHKTILALTADNQATIQLFLTLAAVQMNKQSSTWNPATQKAYELTAQNTRAFFNGVPKLVDKGVKVGGLACDKYVTELEGGEKREVWVTTPEKAGLSPEDYNTFRSLAHLAVEMGGSLLTQMGADMTAFGQNFYGSEVPVAEVLHASGKGSSQFKVLKIHSQSYGAEAFNLPTGYQNLTLLDLMRQGNTETPVQK